MRIVSFITDSNEVNRLLKNPGMIDDTSYSESHPYVIGRFLEVPNKRSYQERKKSINNNYAEQIRSSLINALQI